MNENKTQQNSKKNLLEEDLNHTNFSLEERSIEIMNFNQQIN